LIEDLLGTWPDLRVNIDIKAAGAVDPAVRAIERTGAHDRVCIGSFSDQRRLDVVRRLSAPVATSAGLRAASKFWLGSAMRSEPLSAGAVSQVDCLQVPERVAGLQVLSARSLTAAHALGKQVHVWTVNEPADMRRLLDLGVDGIMTDRADLLRDVFVERGVWTR
jgi:glycerophosphoryl diester phosphodiesterase